LPSCFQSSRKSTSAWWKPSTLKCSRSDHRSCTSCPSARLPATRLLLKGLDMSGPLTTWESMSAVIACGS
jgi:hypothetical protein